MDFQERYRKHKTFIEKRWLPISLEVMLQEGPEKKISILKKHNSRLQMRFRTIDELQRIPGIL